MKEDIKKELLRKLKFQSTLFSLLCFAWLIWAAVKINVYQETAWVQLFIACVLLFWTFILNRVRKLYEKML